MTWDAEPLVLTLQDVCRIMSWTEQAARHRVKSGQCATPVAIRPYRWDREAFRQWLSNGKGITRTIMRRERKAPRPRLVESR